MEDKILEKYKAIVIGGSAGSFKVITQLVANIPKDFCLPVIMSLHRLKDVRNGFVEALSLYSYAKVVEPEDKQNIKKGMIYIAPANYHLCLELGNKFSLSTEEVVNSSRPSIDLTFHSASNLYKEKLIGILLSGANKDGAMGMKKIKSKGGMTIIQDPSECLMPTMPEAAQEITSIDHVLKIKELLNFFQSFNKTLSYE